MEGYYQSSTSNGSETDTVTSLSNPNTSNSDSGANSGVQSMQSRSNMMSMQPQLYGNYQNGMSINGHNYGNNNEVIVNGGAQQPQVMDNKSLIIPDGAYNYYNCDYQLPAYVAGAPDMGGMTSTFSSSGVPTSRSLQYMSNFMPMPVQQSFQNMSSYDSRGRVVHPPPRMSSANYNVQMSHEPPQFYNPAAVSSFYAGGSMIGSSVPPHNVHYSEVYPPIARHSHTSPIVSENNTGVAGVDKPVCNNIRINQSGVLFHGVADRSDGSSNVPYSTLTDSVKVDDLRKLFHLPLSEAAKKLGMCVTLLKNICRKNSISKWPYRKIQSLMRKLHSSEGYLAEGGDKVPESVRISYLDRIASMRNEIEKIKENAVKKVPDQSIRTPSSNNIIYDANNLMMASLQPGNISNNANIKKTNCELSLGAGYSSAPPANIDEEQLSRKRKRPISRDLISTGWVANCTTCGKVGKYRSPSNGRAFQHSYGSGEYCGYYRINPRRIGLADMINNSNDEYTTEK